MTCSRTAGIEEVELGGVVPREARAVVAVVDVALVAGLAVEPLEHDRGVAVVPVVVLEDDPDARVGRQVRAGVGVGRVGRLGERQEPFRMVDRPSANRCPCGWGPCRWPAGCRAPRPGRAGSRRRASPPEVLGDRVVVERIGATRPRRLLPRICLIRSDAVERSHRPISQSPVTPQRASVSSSSSGIASSVRMSRP